MPTTALYQWSVAGSPVNILIELPLVDRLRLACSQPDAEVGGILTGRFSENYTVISDFEPIDSEHRRGTAYTLSHRDEARLAGRMEARSKHAGGAVIGFFRSHLRPGMFLDEGDHQVIASHFSDPREVVLLIKPSADGTATGGFFFWEHGEINRKQTYLSFPMNSQELETGDFPLVEPVGATGFTGTPAHFDTADTMDHLPVRVPEPVAAEAPIPRKRNWGAIGLIAAGAALGGYLFGTMGTQDKFGSRAGDIVVGEPEPAPPVQPVAVQPAAVQPVAVSPPATTENRPSPMPVRTRAQVPVPPPRQLTPEAAPQSEPVQTAAAPAPAQVIPPVTPEAATQVASVTAPPAPGWNHFKDTAPPANDGSVYLESVQNGGIRQAFHRIPLLGSIGGHNSEDFVPPQAIRSFAPRVPKELARGLTGTQPVDLKLKVDRSGRVSSVELLSRGTPPDFVRLAGDAAYDWQFQPAHVKDRPVDSEVIAHFVFHPVY